MSMRLSRLHLLYHWQYIKLLQWCWDLKSFLWGNDRCRKAGRGRPLYPNVTAAVRFWNDGRTVWTFQPTKMCSVWLPVRLLSTRCNLLPQACSTPLRTSLGRRIPPYLIARPQTLPMSVPVSHQPLLFWMGSHHSMPSSIFCSTGIGSAFGVNTTNPAVAFNVTSSSTSAFAPGGPPSVNLTAAQEQPISDSPLLSLSSSSSTGTGGSESFLWTVDWCISSVVVVVKWWSSSGVMVA